MRADRYDLSWARKQHTYLYDQWGIRIAHCSDPKPHKWHGWTHFEDLRCPGVPERPGSERWHPDCLQQGCIRQLHGGEHCGKGHCAVLHTRQRAPGPGSGGE